MFKYIRNIFSSSKNKKSITNGNGMNDLVFLDQFTENIIYSNNYRTLAKKGYAQNVIAYHCINRIATSAQNIPVELYIDGKLQEIGMGDRLTKSLLFNMTQPNADQSGKQLLHEVISHRLIQGEFYVHTDTTSSGVIMDTEGYRPDRIQKNTSGSDKIISMQYNNGSIQKTFERNEDGYFDLLFFKTFNPLSDIDGLSPISAGGMSLEQYNNANEWNKGMFDNGSKLSGILTLDSDGDDFEAMTPEEVKALADDINKKFRSHQGGIAVMNAKGRLDTISLSPQDMDFIEGQKSKAIEICNALNYPPYLLGIAGATFNNQKEAKESLYEEAVLPIINEYYEMLSSYHTRLFDKQIQYKVNLNEISALAEKRERTLESARKHYQSKIMTLAEARSASGLEVIEFGGDIFFGDMDKPNNSNDLNNNV